MNMNIMSMNMNIGLMNMNGRCEHSYEYELYELFYFWAIYVLPVPPRVPTQTKTGPFYPIPPTPQYWSNHLLFFPAIFQFKSFRPYSHDF